MQFLLIRRAAVTGLTGIADVEQGTAHPVIGNLGGPIANIRHVAIGTGNAGPRMRAHAPQLEFRVLCLEDLRAGQLVHVIVERFAIREPHLFPERFLGLHREAFAPGEDERRAGGAVILHMALPADKRAHFVAGRFPVRIVGLGAVALSPEFDGGKMGGWFVRFGQCLNAEDEAGPGHAQMHGVGVVAVDAGDGVGMPHVVEFGIQFFVGVGVGRLEAGHGVALAEGPVDGHDGGMAMQAGSGLGHTEARGLFLVDEHEGVSAPFAVIDGECIALIERRQPGVDVGFLGRQGFTAPMAAEAGAGRNGGAQIHVVLAGPVQPPDGGIGGVFGDFHDANKRQSRLRLALLDVGEQRGDGQGSAGDEQIGAEEQEPGSGVGGHGVIPFHSSGR